MTHKYRDLTLDLRWDKYLIAGLRECTVEKWCVPTLASKVVERYNALTEACLRFDSSKNEVLSIKVIVWKLFKIIYNSGLEEQSFNDA